MALARAVPAFEARVFRPRATRYCLVIPVIDEGPRLARQLGRTLPFLSLIDVVVADGGSRDGSVARERLEPQGVRAVLVKTGPGKLSAQMRMAMDWALQEGYEGLVFIDGNDKDDPAALPAFIEALEAGWDHVQGSRYVAGGVEEHTPVLRRLGVRLVHAPLLSWASGFRYTDTTNGFRAYSRRLLEDPRVDPFREVFSQYELHYYLATRAPRLGYRVKEIPVSRKYPASARVPTKISPVRGSLLILRTLLRACLHRFDPGP
ncbi:MAG: glycosyltransferase family 2 protein [Anaeromyxobacter sp.]|nr:glycosyltransferase family 2 protein [Anaeromyxobacter sp.]